MHAGLGLLRLSPKTFWAMTPIELHAVLGGLRPQSVAPGRGGLEALMRMYPDDGT